MIRTLALVLLAAGLVAAFAPGGATPPREYRFVRMRAEPSQPAGGEPTEAAQQLANAFARDGWILDQVDTTWISTLNDEHASVLLVFRRER